MFSLCALTGDILNNIATSFRNVLIGVLVGTILGFLVRYFPSEDQVNKNKSTLEV